MNDNVQFELKNIFQVRYCCDSLIMLLKTTYLCSYKNVTSILLKLLIVKKITENHNMV